MSTIQQYFEFSQLAQAAYSLFDTEPGVTGLTNKGGFSPIQAAAFLNRTTGYTLRNHQPDTLLNGGFSASVFQSNATGEYTLGIRGTAGLLGDIIGADLFGIAAQGVASSQAASLYRYYKQLTTVAGQAVTYSASELLMLTGLITGSTNPIINSAAYLGLQLSTSSDTGLGVLPAGAKINVAGHSLGGHLAMLFAQMFPAAVNHVYTYNGAGLGGAAYEIINKLGASGSVPNNKVSNIVSDQGWDVTAGVGYVLGSTDRIFIEGNLNPLNNHSIVNLTDPLAIYKLFEQIEPTVSVATLNGIFKAASNTAATSLELAVGYLGKLYNVVTGNVVTNPLTGDRNIYYYDLATLRDAIATHPNAFIVSLTSKSAADIVTQAKTALAYRYALKELNPFAITGDDALYALHNTTGDLDLYDTLTGTGNLTALYLADRAAMLSWLNKTYTEDTDVGRLYDGSAWYFKDEASSKQVWAGNPISVKSDPLLRKVLFGKSGADILTGGDNGDHLYGGLGFDVLSGGAGGDYLEGNLGNDTLNGEDGRDVLVGGEGDDTLTGGLGSDRLEGGKGSDTYVYNNGDGFDVITDADGQGIVRYNTIALTGGAQTGSNSYLSADGKFSYLVEGNLATGATLFINSAMRIDGFKNGQLGLTLGAAITVAPSGVILGSAFDDGKFNYFGSTAPGQEVWGLGGNDGIYLNHDNTTGLGGIGDDGIVGYGIGHTLRGEDGNDQLLVAYSKNGILTDMNDFVGGVFVGMADLSDLNVGANRLYGGLGNDRAIGGPGDDFLEGGDGNDYLDGGLGADLLLGGEGDDVLEGGAGNDVLLGGTGQDILIGDAAATVLNVAYHGNDYLEAEIESAAFSPFTRRLEFHQRRRRQLQRRGQAADIDQRDIALAAFHAAQVTARHA